MQQLSAYPVRAPKHQSKQINQLRGFSPWISKKFAICKLPTDITNTTFSQNKFPTIWKKAEVAPNHPQKDNILDQYYYSTVARCLISSLWQSTRNRYYHIPANNNYTLINQMLVRHRCHDIYIYSRTVDKYGGLQRFQGSGSGPQNFSKAFDSLQLTRLMHALSEFDLTPPGKQQMCLN